MKNVPRGQQIALVDDFRRAITPPKFSFCGSLHNIGILTKWAEDDFVVLHDILVILIFGFELFGFVVSPNSKKPSNACNIQNPSWGDV